MRPIRKGPPIANSGRKVGLLWRQVPNYQNLAGEGLPLADRGRRSSFVLYEKACLTTNASLRSGPGWSMGLVALITNASIWQLIII